jgi:hypothetical protein
VVLGSSPVVAHMMATRDLHGHYLQGPWD